MENICQTPVVKKIRQVSQDSPLNIPPTPQLKHVGHGTGVNVYQFNRPPKEGFERSPWALKKIRHNYKVDELKTRLKKEAKVLQTLDHPNIVGYRGFINKDCLALEQCSTCLGTMKEERLENNLGPFSADIILKVALETAKGLDYLHRVKHILHGDLKSYNILIKDNFSSIKLCDFGVCLPLTDDDVLDKENAGKDAWYIGTPSWSAPEILEDEDGSSVTSKADIFSFGLTLWELMTLGTPHFPDTDSSVSYVFSDEVSLTSTSSASSGNFSAYEKNYGTRPKLPENLGEEYSLVIKLFNMCTEEVPDERPSAAQIIEMLQA
ncbi:unnamed protein product [Bemisia tabaci]|uniref:Protein kinase domain-containing protein n=1 Tax=Bemisia tabaci TaxID=7038 RepID=A0A9P0AP00_BEMTA|nr:unnamed protein product [Bemisia tabaci]